MIYFIGAGPGDPELITVKGKKILESADVVIYAGSLVNRELLSCTKPGTEIHDSAKMTLEQVLTVMTESVALGKTVARVHTGDPSIYGAIREQMDALNQKGIDYEVIPGVSSFLAAAAALKMEYTLPDVTQTVILTRMEGRTGVPGRESIEALSKHRATMVIFLSTGLIENLVEELKKGYPEQTPIAVVYKASWPEQRIIRGNLSDIAQKVSESGIRKTALIVVGDFLGDSYALSKLYDKHFTHEYRSAEA